MEILRRTRAHGAAGRSARARLLAWPLPGRRIPALKLLQSPPHELTEEDRALALGPATGTVEELARETYTLVVTHRPDGSLAFTPVAGAIVGGKLYVRTERESWKAKRLRRDPRALLAPCTVRGTPLGPPLPAHGRVLAPAEERAAERAIARRHGLHRALFELAVDLLRVDMCYLELSPDED